VPIEQVAGFLNAEGNPLSSSFKCRCLSRTTTKQKSSRTLKKSLLPNFL
jgi:hypothetical protein